jgi:hypothetical protein
VERRRGREELVRAGEVTPVVPAAARRRDARDSAQQKLRRPGLLSDPAEIKRQLADEARALGFSAIGITKPDAAPETRGRLEAFLADGAHGDMAWMETTAARRGDPRELRSHFRTLVMLCEKYVPD